MFNPKLCCEHEWAPTHGGLICLACDAFCIKERGKIVYYSYPVKLEPSEFWQEGYDDV